MTTYALLPRAAANRVYGATSLALLQAELALVDRLALGGVVEHQSVAELGGVDYLLADCGDRSLDDLQVGVVSNLSTLHALFAVQGGLLRPVEVKPRREQDEDVTTIQRYVGKTNEQFTHLLVNVTLAAAERGLPRLVDGEVLRLLDPLCGRGTSLNQAVLYGFDAYGVEIDRRDVDAYSHFILTWLKDKRLKHQVERANLRRGREVPAKRLSITYGRDAKGSRRRIEVVHDDTVNALEHFKERSFDVVVADLPYGVQHETRPGEGRISRHPDVLLRKALPVWRRLLRGTGAIGLSWNLRTLERDLMFSLLAAADLHPCVEPDDDSFVHRVDRAITRDLVVATRGPRR
jgi:SAM-dependent methyltransferase